MYPICAPRPAPPPIPVPQNPLSHTQVQYGTLLYSITQRFYFVYIKNQNKKGIPTVCGHCRASAATNRTRSTDANIVWCRLAPPLPPLRNMISNTTKRFRSYFFPGLNPLPARVGMVSQSPSGKPVRVPNQFDWRASCLPRPRVNLANISHKLYSRHISTILAALLPSEPLCADAKTSGIAASSMFYSVLHCRQY